MKAGKSIDWPQLERAALSVRHSAHAPYSGYLVGAALLTRSGKVFAGCNVENASYGLAICAERNAIAQMVAAAERDPIAIVVVTEGPRAASPCGMCRQTLAEFAIDLPVRLVAAGVPSATRTTSLAELLPDAFRSDSLEPKRRDGPHIHADQLVIAGPARARKKLPRAR